MDDGHQISTAEIKGYFAMLREPTVQMCRNMLKQSLFCRGIELESGDLKELEEPYIRFLEDAFDCCLFLGFVPYRIIDYFGSRIPVVCPPDTFDAYVVTDRFQCVDIVLYERDEASNSGTNATPREIKDSHVFLDFGHNPDTTGHLSSMLSGIRSEIGFSLNLRTNLQRMENKRSDPPVLTETTENGNATGGEDVEYGLFADADLAEEAEAAKFRRTDSQMKAIRDQTDIYHSWLGENEQSAAPSGIFPLPSGQKFVNAPLPDGRHDFVQIRRSVQDLIFGSLGVPRSMIFSDGTHKGDQEGTHRTFESTIAWWKRTLGRCASEAKIRAETKAIVKTLREKRKAKESRSGGDSSKRIRFSASELVSIKRDNTSKFSFPTVPSLRLDEVHVLYDRGALGWKHYLETVGILTGLNMDLSLPEPEPEEEGNMSKDNTGDTGAEVKISKDGEVHKKGDQQNPEKKGQTTAQNEAAKKNKQKAK